MDVFISYKRSEVSFAQRIASKLRRLGFEVWYDTSIPSGKSFDSEIEAALRQAKAVLVLWSPGAVVSDWVRNEAGFAREHEKLVALMVRPCELPIAFRTVQCEPLSSPQFPDEHPSWLKVVERIKDLTLKRQDVEVRQKQIRLRRTWVRTLAWLAAWPVVGMVVAGALAWATTAKDNIGPGSADVFLRGWDSGWISASGSWELEGQPLAAMVNHTEIRCYRDEGVCFESAAEILPLYAGSKFLRARLERRPIERWDDRVVVTRNKDECYDYVMTIGRDTETVTALQLRPADIASRPACNFIPRVDELTKRQEYRLIDGSERASTQEIANAGWQLPALFTLLGLWSFVVLVSLIRTWRPA